MVCNSVTSLGIMANKTEYIDHDITDKKAMKSPNGLSLSTNTPLNTTQATPARAIRLPNTNHFVSFITPRMMNPRAEKIGTVAQIRLTLVAPVSRNAL